MSDDIERAKIAMSLEDVMRRYGLDDFIQENTFSPFRRGDNRHAFGVYRDAGVSKWKDRVSGAGGDQIDFISEYEGCSMSDAIIKFLEISGVRRGTEPAPAPQKKLRRRIEAENEEAQPAKPPFDWKKCVDAMSDADAANVADWRGLSADIITALRTHSLIGMYTPWAAGSVPAVAFPVMNDGIIVGCHYRIDETNAKAMSATGREYGAGEWIYTPGVKVKPLVIGDPAISKSCHIFESQWDAIAVADRLGWTDWHLDKSMMIITRGASNGKMIAGMVPKDARVTIWMQNDKPHPRTGKIPAEEWYNDVTKALGEGAKWGRIDIPGGHKDANDWVRAGASSWDLCAAISEARDSSLDGVTVTNFKSLLDFDPKNDPNCLIGDRWICKTGSALWIGQSGIGKSSLMVQAAVMWALDQSLFGIKPKRNLKSLIIQAENDEGDIAEMMQGVIKALDRKFPGAISDIIEILQTQLIFVRDTIHTAGDFAKTAAKLIKKFEPDLVWGDPLLSYAGDDISQQKVASTFLRNHLNPVAFDTGIAWMMLHHTGKPNADSKSKAHWKENDHSYVGLGSSELTNWARAVNVLATTEHDGVYKLMLPKRGTRADMREPGGIPTTCAHLTHAEYPQIFWNQIHEPEPLPKERKPGTFESKYSLSDITKFLSPLIPSRVSDIQKRCASDLGLSEKTFYRLWAAAKSRGLVRQISDGWVREKD